MASSGCVRFRRASLKLSCLIGPREFRIAKDGGAADHPRDDRLLPLRELFPFFGDRRVSRRCGLFRVVLYDLRLAPTAGEKAPTAGEKATNPSESPGMPRQRSPPPHFFRSSSGSATGRALQLYCIFSRRVFQYFLQGRCGRGAEHRLPKRREAGRCCV